MMPDKVGQIIHEQMTPLIMELARYSLPGDTITLNFEPCKVTVQFGKPKVQKGNYRLVQWPDSQQIMDHERFGECIFVMDLPGHNEVGDSAYMCPEDLYNEIFKSDDTDNKH